MKKVIIVLIIITSLVFVNNSRVYADNKATIKVRETTPEDTKGAINITTTGLESCGAFGDPKTEGTFANYLQKAFNVVKFLGIVIAIIMTIKDLAKAVAEQKNDTFQKLGKTTLKRIIYAMLIFFVPSLLNLLFSLLGLYGTCGII